MQNSSVLYDQLQSGQVTSTQFMVVFETKLVSSFYKPYLRRIFFRIGITVHYKFVFPNYEL